MVKELEHMMDVDRLRTQGVFCLNRRRLGEVLVSVCNYLSGWTQTLTRSAQ